MSVQLEELTTKHQRVVQQVDRLSQQLQVAQAAATEAGEARQWREKASEATRLAATRAAELAVVRTEARELIAAVQLMAQAVQGSNGQGAEAAPGGDGEGSASSGASHTMATSFSSVSIRTTITTLRQLHTRVVTTIKRGVEAAAGGHDGELRASAEALRRSEARAADLDDALSDMARLRDMAKERLEQTLERVVELEVCRVPPSLGPLGSGVPVVRRTHAVHVCVRLVSCRRPWTSHRRCSRG